MIRVIAICLALLVMAGCGKDTEPEFIPEIEAREKVNYFTPAIIEEPEPIKQEDLTAVRFQTARGILNDLLPKAYRIFERYRTTTLAHSDTVHEGVYYKVEDETATSVEACKAEIEAVFTKEIAETEFYEYLFDLEKYKEIDGVLCVNPEFGDLAWESVLDLNTMQLLTYDTDVITVQFQTKITQTSDVETESSVVIKMVQIEPDVWRLDSSIL